MNIHLFFDCRRIRLCVHCSKEKEGRFFVLIGEKYSYKWSWQHRNDYLTGVDESAELRTPA